MAYGFGANSTFLKNLKNKRNMPGIGGTTPPTIGGGNIPEQPVFSAGSGALNTLSGAGERVSKFTPSGTRNTRNTRYGDFFNTQSNPAPKVESLDEPKSITSSMIFEPAPTKVESLDEPKVTQFSSVRDENGVLTDADGKKYDQDGNLVDEMGRRIDADGNIIEPSATESGDADFKTDEIDRGDIDLDPEDEVDFNKTKTSPYYNDALRELSGAARGEGLSGTNAAITKSREILAAANKQAEGRAGAIAQTTGALGQGTANSLFNQTRQDALQAMAGQELSFIEMKGQDQKDAIDRIVSAEQAEKDDMVSAESLELQKSGQFLTMEQMNRQFSHMDADLRERIASRMQNGEQFDFNRMDEINRFAATMELTEKQWEAEFGADEANRYIGQLLELSIENPVLAQKIQNHLLTGKKGALGDFTEDEIAEIERLRLRAEEQEDSIQNVYTKQLENLGKQQEIESQSVTDELAGNNALDTKFNKATETGEWSKFTSEDFSKMTELQKDSLASSATEFTGTDAWNSGKDPDNYSDSSAKKAHWEANGRLKPGDAVMKGGTVYIIINPAKIRDAGGDNKRVMTWALNTETGKEMSIHNSDKFENSLFGMDEVSSGEVYTDSEGNMKTYYP